MTDESIGAQLVGWGKVVLVETIGRTSGRPITAAVGFVENGNDLLVAAGSETADWALNLSANSRCRATIGDATHDYVAQPLTESEAAAVVAALILKYGTPAEKLGRGPAFRLTRAD